MIIRIEQEDTHGCGLACLAMLTGKTYEEVRLGFDGHDFSHGITIWQMQDYLAEHGYATAVKYPHYSPRKKDREVWPPPPFANVHFVHVDGRHYIVMLRDGTVYDPAPNRDGQRQIDQYDQAIIFHIAGVTPIGGST